jgi:hypothetical protein
MSDETVTLFIVAVVVAVVGAFWYWRRRRSTKLRSKFGGEYDLLVARKGNRWGAESELQRREERFRKLSIRPLTREEAERFAATWRAEQRNFIDDPHGAVSRAGELVDDVLKAAGYPAHAFEERAADISVEYPNAVRHYRAAHSIAVRDHLGRVDTESLRVAMQHYKQIFDELLQARQMVELR